MGLSLLLSILSYDDDDNNNNNNMMNTFSHNIEFAEDLTCSFSSHILFMSIVNVNKGWVERTHTHFIFGSLRRVCRGGNGLDFKHVRHVWVK